MALLPKIPGWGTGGWALVPEAALPGDIIYILRHNAGYSQQLAVLRPCADDVSLATRELVIEGLRSQGCELDGIAIFHGSFIGNCILDTRYRDYLRQAGYGKEVVVLY